MLTANRRSVAAIIDIFPLWQPCKNSKLYATPGENTENVVPRLLLFYLVSDSQQEFHRIFPTLKILAPEIWGSLTFLTSRKEAKIMIEREYLRS